MRKEEGLTPAEREFEQALAGLQPAGTSIDRDQLMYQAGYAAANRRGRVWQGAAMLLAVGLAASLVVQGFTSRGGPGVQIATGPIHVRQLPVLAEPSPTDREPASTKPSYLLLRNEVLEKGMAALPQSDYSGQTALPRQPTLQDLLGEPPKPIEPIVSHRVPILDYILQGGRS